MTNPASQFLHCGGTHLDFLIEAYRLLIASYEELMSYNYDANTKNENQIRDDLVRIAELKKTNLRFEWDTESRNLQQGNRIDITLITPLSLGKGIGKRLTVECKILSDGSEYIDTVSSHSRAHSPTNGIMSFISGKYASEMPIAGMIGFLKNGDIAIKINGVKERLNTHQDIQTLSNLAYFEIKNGFDHSYESEHNRPKNSSIKIYHLFFTFAHTI